MVITFGYFNPRYEKSKAVFYSLISIVLYYVVIKFIGDKILLHALYVIPILEFFDLYLYLKRYKKSINIKMNLKFKVSYDGSCFQGSQNNQMVKQLKINFYLHFKKINIETNIVLSGRTDKEVHATGQVFNCLF